MLRILMAFSLPQGWLCAGTCLLDGKLPANT